MVFYSIQADKDLDEISNNVYINKIISNYLTVS